MLSFPRHTYDRDEGDFIPSERTTRPTRAQRIAEERVSSQYGASDRFQVPVSRATYSAKRQDPTQTDLQKRRNDLPTYRVDELRAVDSNAGKVFIDTGSYATPAGEVSVSYDPASLAYIIDQFARLNTAPGPQDRVEVEPNPFVRPGKSFYLPMVIEGVFFQVIPDTGSCINVISTNALKIIQEKSGSDAYARLSRTRVSFPMADGTPLYTYQPVRLNWQFYNSSPTARPAYDTFYPVDIVGSFVSVVVGCRFLQDYSVMTSLRWLVERDSGYRRTAKLLRVGQATQWFSLSLDQIPVHAYMDSGSDVDLISPEFVEKNHLRCSETGIEDPREVQLIDGQTQQQLSQALQNLAQDTSAKRRDITTEVQKKASERQKLASNRRNTASIDAEIAALRKRLGAVITDHEIEKLRLQQYYAGNKRD
ncbi:hypothetical protein H2200_001910 [Cladophialophora chaetospira]|uniref:Uncharacterized protein n=1 Tax=Cladophialophora chaetospira TaxID=386627 RepID=A0AA39CNG0_9EURO|nr:hypothetical protein H2200_001910 [Cladophialophora chaetospira]